ncbi:MAG TPA: chemoreceptor glutamine deamidase CheD [Gammaproteobacteria bacterium]|nr:chemoreceptor glutamine deamidase CheD [Gammaproteobacteria bacterium]
MTTLNAGQPPVLPRPLRGFEHVKRYWDKTNEAVVAKILPGELYVTRINEMITTVLGSCISACIRDPYAKVGGMNHFMLPMSKADNVNGDKFGSAMRYGNFAMEHLINEIIKNGGQRKNLEVKLFGGGRVLAHMTDVGQRNIEFALEYVQVEGLKLIADDLGDRFPRKVQYYPASGVARMKKLRSMHNRTIVEREEAYMKNIVQTPVSGEIELF